MEDLLFGLKLGLITASVVSLVQLGLLWLYFAFYRAQIELGMTTFTEAVVVTPSAIPLSIVGFFGFLIYLDWEELGIAFGLPIVFILAVWGASVWHAHNRFREFVNSEPK